MIKSCLMRMGGLIKKKRERMRGYN